MMEGKLTRRDMLRLGGGALASAYLLGLTGCGSGGSGGSGSKTLTVGNIGWDENVAVSNLTKILVEQDLGYDSASLKTLDVGLLFDGVATGELDTFQDVWLPNTHSTYWEKYKDRVVDLGRWYEGEANLGLAVPDYVEAQSIADLNDYRDEFGGRIVGIESGSGIMKVTEEEAIPQYGLDYELASSSTAAMLAEVERAVGDEKPIVFTAWKPHWVFTAHPVRYLEDPKGAMGGAEKLTAIAREGLEEDAPDAFALLGAISLTEDQLGELELSIQESENPASGTEAWLEDNRDVVKPWIDAAKEA